jgi:hypothetical protein
LMKRKIYKIIKDESGASLDRITSVLGGDRQEIKKILDGEVAKNFLVITNGRYDIKTFLMPPVQKPAEGVAWGYGKIQKGGPVVDLTLPVSIMNKYNNKVAPRQQGNRGTCVGQSSAAMKDYLYYGLTKQEPTGTIIRDIFVETAIRDQLYDQSFSAECIYAWSRQEGNVTAPSGSYCNAAIRALYKRGVCLESQWYTSKDGRAVWQTPFPEVVNVCEWAAAQHKLEGYAVIRTLNELKRCLVTHGVAIGAINIYDNYTSGQTIKEDGQDVIDGNLPDNKGEPIGSHALCWIGYSDETERLYFRHSWKGWTKLGSISYAYYNDAAGDFWAPLDTEEVLIGKSIYQTIEISATPQEASDCAVLTINGVQRTEKLPARIIFEKGQNVTIVVSAPGYISKTRSLTPVDESISSIIFNMEAGIIPEPVVPLWRRILNWILGLFKR